MRVNILVNGMGNIPFDAELAEVRLTMSDGYPLNLKPLDHDEQEVFRSSNGFSILTTIPLLLSPYEEEHLKGAALVGVELKASDRPVNLADENCVICSVSLIELNLLVGANVHTFRSCPPLGSRDFESGEVEIFDPYVTDGENIEFNTNLHMSIEDIDKKFGIADDADRDCYVYAILYYNPKTGDVSMQVRVKDGDARDYLVLSNKEKEYFRQQCENYPYPDGKTALEFVSN